MAHGFGDRSECCGWTGLGRFGANDSRRARSILYRYHCRIMKCIVTAGPTYEPLDGVRRLTNFSTGRLGSELANFLAARGHETTLLIGQQATFRGERHARKVETFTTTANLRDRLQALAGQPVDAVFHAAAVSDFTVGKVWRRAPRGELTEVHAGKLSTRGGNAAGRTGANAEDHRRTAPMVPSGVARGMEV